MEKITSFTINHLKLLRGIYVSRVDTLPNGDVVTTFDIRMKQPNREPAVSQSALHTIEHLAATFLRNHPQWKERVRQLFADVGQAHLARYSATNARNLSLYHRF